ITAHAKINTIAFTGGTVTGKKVAEAAAPMFKKVSLELGGKNPNIIFADADLDAAIAGSVRSSFANQGQVCLCGSRVFVERSAYKDFVDRFINKASQLKMGDPFDNEEEVIGYANDTDYGLASSVWTQNLNRAHRVAEQIHTGTVWVNCWLVRDLRVPFGGMKASGVGREGGEEALRFFTEPKNV